MGLMNKFGKMLGFSGGAPDEDDDLDEMRYSPNRTPYVNPFKKEDSVIAEEEKPVPPVEPVEPMAMPPVVVEATSVKVADDELPSNMFDELVEIINGNLPKFIIDCLDIEAEKKALFAALSPQLQPFVASMSQSAVDNAQKVWSDERASLMSQLSTLKTSSQQSEAKVTELRDKLNNEISQRRAIVERSHELEGKISSLEAEREQLELEKKGLLNKIKVMEVNSNDVTFYRDEVDRLKKANNEQLQAVAAAKQAEQTIVNLTSQVESLKAENASLKLSKIDVAQAEKAVEERLANEYKEKMAFNNAMCNDLRQRLADKEAAAKAAIADMQVKDEQIQQLEEQLTEATEQLEIANEIQSQLELFEGIKRKKDAEISQLKADLATARSQAGDAQKDANESVLGKNKEIEALKAQIEQLKITHANHESDLNIRLENVREQLKETTMRLELSEAQVQSLSQKLEAPVLHTPEHTFDDSSVDDMFSPGGDDAEMPDFMKESKAEKRKRKSKKSKETAVPAPAELQSLPEPTEVVAPEPIAAEEPVAPKPAEEESPFSAVDEFDDIDWLVPTPPGVPEEKPEEPEEEVDETTGEGQLSFFF